jgi:uracil-DNA glycosylase family 4
LTQENLRHTPANCPNCPLSRVTKNTYVPTHIVSAESLLQDNSPRVDILFLGESPGFDEQRTHIPFSGQSGRMLRELVESINTRRSSPSGRLSVAYGNVVRCRPTQLNEEGMPENRPPTSAELSFCKPYSSKDIEKLRPRVVVLLGGTAISSMAPDSKSASWLNGKAAAARNTGYKEHKYPHPRKPGKFFTTRFVATYHPSYISRHMEFNDSFHEDIHNAFRLAAGEVQDDAERNSRMGVSHLVDTLDKFDTLIDTLTHKLHKEQDVAFDTETTTLNRVGPQSMLSWQFAWNNDEAWVVPYSHKESPFSADQLEHIQKKLKKLFKGTNSFRYWVMHNAKFDFDKVQRFLGVKVLGNPVFDTLFGAYLLDENRVKVESKDGPYSLKTLAPEWLGFQEYHTLEAVLAARATANLANVKLQELSDYGGMDAYVTWRLKNEILKRAGSYAPKLERFAINWFSRVVQTLTVIERNGIYVDRKQLFKLQSVNSPIITRINEIDIKLKNSDIYKAANKALLLTDGRTKGMKMLFGSKEPEIFKLGTKLHKIELLINQTGLKPVKFGQPTKLYPKGEPAIDKAFFAEYKGVEVVDLVSERAGLDKLRTSYTANIADFLATNADMSDGRIRPSIIAHRTVTGRLATQAPNSSQVPRCFLPGTLVTTNEGIFPIEQIVGDKLRMELPIGESIVDHHEYTTESVVLIKAALGYGGACTLNHRVQVIDDNMNILDVEAQHLIPGVHQLLVKVGTQAWGQLNELPVFVGARDGFDAKKARISKLPTHMTPELARILGYLVSEGYYADKDSNSIEFWNQDLDILSDFSRCWEFCFGDILNIKKDNRTHKYKNGDVYKIYISSAHVKRFLNNIGLASVTSHKKRVPWCIMQSPRAIVAEYLAAYIAGDGNVMSKVVRMHTVSKKMALELQVLLTNMGCLVSRTFSNPPRTTSGIWCLTVATGLFLHACSDVPLLRAFHREKASSVKPRSRIKDANIVGMKNWVENELFKYEKVRVKHKPGESVRVYRNKITGKELPLPYMHLRETLALEFSHDYLRLNPTIMHGLKMLSQDKYNVAKYLLKNNLVPLDILSTKVVQKNTKVYDIETVTHHYIANGFISHNSDTPSKQEIKSMFTAAPGNFLVEVDYSQAEVRWWAQIAQDEEYGKVFERMLEIRQKSIQDPTNQVLKKKVELECDVHRQVAALMFRKTLVEVTKDERQGAKALCVDGNTWIRTPQGMQKIKHVVNTWNGPVQLETRTGVETAVKTFKVLVDKTIRIKTSRGFVIKGRPEHPILVWRECKLQYVELQHLVDTDRVAIRRGCKLWPQAEVPMTPYVWSRKYANGKNKTGQTPGHCNYPTHFNADLARLVGYLVSEGTHCYPNVIHVCNKNSLILADLRKILTNYFGSSAFHEQKPDKRSGVVTFVLNKRATHFLRLNMAATEGVDSHSIRVPDIILKSPRHIVIDFMRAYLAGDASYRKENIKATSASIKLVRELQILLLDLGVISAIHTYYIKTTKGEGWYHDLTITGRDAERLYLMCPPIRTHQVMNMKKKWNKSNIDILFGLQALCSTYRATNGYAKGTANKREYPKIYTNEAAELTVTTIKNHWDEFMPGLEARNPDVASHVREVINGDYFLDVIEKKTENSTKDQVVYDFTVPGSHSFVSNGLISHNCFGSIFGQSIRALSLILKISEEEAEALQKKFLGQFKRAGQWLFDIEASAERRHYTETPMGRRRRLGPMFLSQDKSSVGRAKRQARNSPIQAASSDNMVLMGSYIQTYIRENRLPWMITNLVHDAITFEVPINFDDFEHVIRISEEMMTARMVPVLKDLFDISMFVPFEVEAKVGVRLGHVDKVNVAESLEANFKKLILDANEAYPRKLS